MDACEGPLPVYDDLPRIAGTDLRHAWDVFGRNDLAGTVNLINPELVVAAAGLVTSGVTIRLDLPLDEPKPPLFGRESYRHTVFALNRNEMDDRLDGFYPQGSTQWDGLGHIRCREHGYWGGRLDDPTDGRSPLGIDVWGRRGITGRGVLVDMGAWYERHRLAYDALGPSAITADDLAAALAEQEVELERGDILCIRTGWVGAYRRLNPHERAAYATEPRFAGLPGSEATARFLWDAHVAALVCDNPAVEVVPGDPAVGSLHRRLIPLLGMALGELFDLEALADRCHEMQRWAFLFVSTPWQLPRGLGSPGNAIAIL